MIQTRPFRRAVLIATVSLAATLSACVSVKMIPQGNTTVGQRLNLQLDRTWNELPNSLTFVPTWTNEGVSIDTLEFYVGIKDGATLPARSAKGQAPLTFKASMGPSDVVALFRAKLTQDGSSFQLDKLAPVSFLNSDGFRFEYTLNRKSDDVVMKGVAMVTIRQSELFVMHYTAPRLVFFPRHLQQFNAMANSARLSN